MTSFRHFLVPTDFSESSQRALDRAVDLAEDSRGALMTLVHIYEVPSYAPAGHAGPSAMPIADVTKALEQYARVELDNTVAAHPALSTQVVRTCVQSVPTPKPSLLPPPFRRYVPSAGSMARQTDETEEERRS